MLNRAGIEKTGNIKVELSSRAVRTSSRKPPCFEDCCPAMIFMDTLTGRSNPSAFLLRKLPRTHNSRLSNIKRCSF